MIDVLANVFDGLNTGADLDIEVCFEEAAEKGTVWYHPLICNDHLLIALSPNE